MTDLNCDYICVCFICRSTEKFDCLVFSLSFFLDSYDVYFLTKTFACTEDESPKLITPFVLTAANFVSATT